MRITAHRGVDGELAGRFLVLYREAFAPLAELGAQRQALHDDEFLAVLADPRVVELVGWDDEGEAVAMAVMAGDLEAIPWFSPPFFRARLAERSQRSGVYGIIAILVHPDARGGPWYRAMAEAVALKAHHDDAVVVFDCCAHNVEVFPLPATLEAIGRGIFDEVELAELDTQHYFALDAHGLRLPLDGRIGLAGGEVTLDAAVLAGPEPVVDLREDPVIDLRDTTSVAEPATERRGPHGA